EAGTKPPEVRQAIQDAQKNGAPKGLRSVLLFGAVPRVFSGWLNPDGHPEHRGAWPAGGYYADLAGGWTDDQGLGTPGVSANANVKGDGVFDQVFFPSALDLAVGRVDARYLPAFGMSDVDLLRRYLDNEHAYRTGAVKFGAKGLVTDAFG